MKRRARASILLLIGFSFVACSSERDLERICGAFDRLAARSDLAGMPASERMRIVQADVDETLSSLSKVQPLWRAFPNSVNESRYRMFKSGAEELLGQQWACSNMARLAPTLGE